MPKKKKQVAVVARAGSMGSISQPVDIKCNSVVRSWYRFSAANAQGGTVVTVGNLLGCQGSVVVTAILCQSIMSSFRVKKIRMWCPAAVAGNNLMEITWATGGLQVKDDVKIASTVGSANSAYYETKPPPKTFSSMWFDSATPANSVFTLTCPTSTIVDVYLEGVISNAFVQPTGVAFGNAATFALGKIFFPSLDGPGTHNLTTVGRPTTF